MSKGILTPREKKIFQELTKNKTTKEIAHSLGISEKTVRNHISNTMQKLGVKGRASAVVELIKLKEISIDHEESEKIRNGRFFGGCIRNTTLKRNF